MSAIEVLLVGKGSPERGGIASFLHQMVSAPEWEGVEVEFLNLARPSGGRMGRFSLGNVRRTIADAVTVLRRSGGRDVVHIHSAFVPGVTILRAGVLARMAAMRRARVVMHIHGGLLPAWLDDGGSSALIRWALRPVDRVAAVSREGLEIVEPVVGRDRAVLIRNGVDVVSFRPAERRDTVAPPVVGYVGVMSERKGLLDLFEASRLLVARGRPHELVLVGGMPAEGSEEYASVSSAAPSWARFVGSVDRDSVPGLLVSMDVFCLPSWWEAAPLSILEAMACGVPVVATEVGDIPAMVNPGVTGLIVLPRDAAALADALEAILVDPERRRSMGVRGRERAVAEFDWSVTIEAISGLYRELA